MSLLTRGLSFPLSLTLLALTLNTSWAATKYSSSVVQKGRYLTQIMSCNDCHTPHLMDSQTKMLVPDMKRELSGHQASSPEAQSAMNAKDALLIGPDFTAMALPFGKVYSANLTPDDQTGIGSWTEEEFIQTLLTGRHKGTGRAILPPMPWPNYVNAKKEDLVAIYAYLKSLRPVKNAVPQPVVAAEFMKNMEKSNETLARRMKAEDQGASRRKAE